MRRILTVAFCLKFEVCEIFFEEQNVGKSQERRWEILDKIKIFFSKFRED